jgi:hypothetical protein
VFRSPLADFLSAAEAAGEGLRVRTVVRGQVIPLDV